MNYLPKCSFTIPTFNSSRTLQRCLESIKSQLYPCIEIIVVDGYSSDNSRQIAERYADQVYLCNGSLSESRQVGIQHATGDIIGIFDSDVVFPHRLWLRRAVKKFRQNVSTVWPLQISMPGAPLISQCFLYYQWAIIKRRYSKGVGIFGGGNALFLKRCVEEVGGFNMRQSCYEDFYLAKKLMDRRYSVVLYCDPIYHATHLSWLELLRKDLRRNKELKAQRQNVSILPYANLIQENVREAPWLMLKGIFIDREPSLVLLPFLVTIRASTFLLSLLL